MNELSGLSLQVKGLTARYGQIEALHTTDLHIDQGELVAVLGPNGAGKSTLLRRIIGLVAGEGTVSLAGVPLPPSDPRGCAMLGVVLVPEGRGIFGPMTVFENLDLGAYLATDKAEIKRRLERVFTLFPRLKDRQKQLAGSLSGGEQQMLAIARALMARPKLLLLDEPSLGLAPLITKQIFAAIKKLNEEEGLTVFLVEQNAYHALRLAHRGYVMVNGTITMQGTGKALLSDPQVQAAYLEGGHH